MPTEVEAICRDQVASAVIKIAFLQFRFVGEEERNQVTKNPSGSLTTSFFFFIPSPILPTVRYGILLYGTAGNI